MSVKGPIEGIIDINSLINVFVLLLINVNYFPRYKLSILLYDVINLKLVLIGCHYLLACLVNQPGPR